ncbi:AAA-domain-containing protein [Ophiobolus disseminans]|uniref:AAA-domain-containing protein n=1 Tax=Ophiobolus disseminans TaxID=1469910 RepID=A0A6A7AFF1_9PLEO|nr:AAA-domain-containing protein [Ophiobolus disseminans]
MDITVYTLHTNEDGDRDADADVVSTQGPFTVTKLPHEAFDGQWERLVYEEPTGELLLRAFSRAIREFHNNSSSLAQSAWSNTALFHGPPGSGKTSLALALAQQLSVRLSIIYPHTKLLRVDSSSVFSHMYGETPKAIGSLFTTIGRLAVETEGEEGPSLIIVLVDEIDKLVPSRKRLGGHNEPQDTIRAAPEVFTGLDRLRESVNVIWFFTTNLVEDLDPAFIDRCRFMEEVKTPAANCVFEMLRADINARIRRGRIAFKTLVYGHHCDTIMTDAPKDLPQCSEQPHEIPSLVWATRYWPSTATTAVTVLRQIATLAAGLSGRMLRGLLDVAIFQYLVDDKPDLRQVLDALELVVRKEITQRSRKALDSTMTDEILPSSITDDFDFEFVGNLPIETNQYSDDE